MFERYTEKARRSIFFARYEASQFGSPQIESEHLLLGLMRESSADFLVFLPELGTWDTLRAEIGAHSDVREKTSTSVDLPLSNECKRILAYGAEEAERLCDKHIGTEHLLLGLLREEGCFARQLLLERGADLKRMRKQVAGTHSTDEPARFRGQVSGQVRVSSRPGPAPGAQRVDLYQVRSVTPFGTKLLRVLWHCVQLPFFEHTPRMLSPLRVLLLRMFGAKIGRACHIGPGVKIWIPWNLTMGERSAIGMGTEIYNFAPVSIGDHVVVSQRGYVCTSTHDYTHPHFPLVSTPIRIESQAWVAAEVFLSPGVTIGEGAVIGACSVVTKSMPPWMVCAGNPCRPLKQRVIKPVE